jgi:hypothetical protein
MLKKLKMGIEKISTISTRQLFCEFRFWRHSLRSHWQNDGSAAAIVAIKSTQFRMKDKLLLLNPFSFRRTGQAQSLRKYNCLMVDKTSMP